MNKKMEKSSLEALPQELQMDILLQLPLKSLVQCICVSTKWASLIHLIRSAEFKDRYLRSSKTRPRVLFVVTEIGFFPDSYRAETLFHSVYQEDETMLLSSGQQKISIYEAPFYSFSQPIRGLILFQGSHENKNVICNPGTKTFLTLPQIQRPNNASMMTFFGYDGVSNVFKVLCVTRIRSEVTNEYHVYTVGSGEEPSWRLITCETEHDHSPVTKELCKGGFLYYGAHSNSGKSLVMRFDVRSEVFTVIDLPKDVKITYDWRLVKYNANIALVNDSVFHYGIRDRWNRNGNGVFDMWVWDEESENWWRNHIEMPHWEETVDNKKFYFKGTIGTGELAFAPMSWSEGQLFVLYYDTVTRNLRRFEIEGMVGKYPIFLTFFNHVDSTWLM